MQKSTYPFGEPVMKSRDSQRKGGYLVTKEGWMGCSEQKGSNPVILSALVREKASCSNLALSDG